MEIELDMQQCHVFSLCFDKIATQFTIYVACVFLGFLQMSNKNLCEFATHQRFFPMNV